MLAAGLFLPHPSGLAPGLAVLAGSLVLLVAALAAVETAQAKMRLLRVPPTLFAGVVVALIGVASAAAGAHL